VNEAGRRFGVASELMYAIMRQESSFDPLARSHADAFGLMQLIPEAARRVEEVSGIKLESPEDLYRPDVNVTLGAAFLRNLMNQHNEQFILTVASYNASEKAIRGWMKTRFRGDALEFIEDIPYEETRGYVKLVMRNYIFYLRLNSGGRPVPFPEWCLDSLHDFNS
jgi:soluble lytic murein transglycosylase